MRQAQKEWVFEFLDPIRCPDGPWTAIEKSNCETTLKPKNVFELFCLKRNNV